MEKKCWSDAECTGCGREICGKHTEHDCVVFLDECEESALKAKVLEIIKGENTRGGCDWCVGCTEIDGRGPCDLIKRLEEELQ